MAAAMTLVGRGGWIGLLVRYRRRQVLLDGGAGAEPTGRLAAWLVSDERSELRSELRALCAARGLHPAVAAASVADLMIEPHRAGWRPARLRCSSRRKA